jgi:phage recombination protein Bet
MNDRAHGALVKVSIPSLAMKEEELVAVLQSSVYPGAKIESIKLVIGYCRSQNLDPVLKPVHIVPMDVPTGKKDSDGWDITEKRDVIMPGIGLYRIQASRAGEHAGTTEPEFGPDVKAKLGDLEITHPAWCRVIVRRAVNGRIDEYPAVERWVENYATKGRKSKEPNKMWAKRPYAQLAKCAEAQALRKAFPEIGSQPTAEEMEGKTLDEGVVIDAATGAIAGPRAKSEANPKPEVKEELQSSVYPGAKIESKVVEEGAKDKPKSDDTPMPEGPMRILKAMLGRAALTENDLIAKFGAIDALKFGQFEDIKAWIAEKGQQVAG